MYFAVIHSANAQSDHLAKVADCKPIRPKSNIQQFVLIKQSGCYVVEHSFDQGWLFDFSSGGRTGPVGRQMILTWAQGTEIDLAGFSLKTNTSVDGIRADPGRGDGPKKVPFGLLDVHRLVVRNGTISLRNEDSDKSGADGTGVVSPYQAYFVHRQYGSADPIPTQFQKVEYLLENLTIKTGNAAALLMGDGITIRNCTIEVEGEHALVIYGPNALIENNRIVYRYRDPLLPRQRATLTEPSNYPDLHAAIYLRAADNAIVRGNTIHIKEGNRPVSAVAVVDSKGVQVEGNQFNTDVTPVVLSGASTATLKHNEVEGGIFSKKRLLPDAELR